MIATIIITPITIAATVGIAITATARITVAVIL